MPSAVAVGFRAWGVLWFWLCLTFGTQAAGWHWRLASTEIEHGQDARATQPQDVGATRPLRWAADAEGGAPYIFKDPTNPALNIGFEVDLAQALEKELGRRIEFQQYAFPSLIAGVQRGDFDFAMNGLEITEDRAKAVRFTRPYYLYRLQLAVRAEETRFNSLDECKAAGGVVGTLEDTAAERLLDKMGIAKKVYDGQVEPYLDLQLGRIDAVLMDLPIAVYYARPNPKLRFAGEPLASGYYAIALRKDQEELARQLDAAIARLARSGQLRAIYQKWNLWNEDQEALFAGAENTDVLLRSRAWSWIDCLWLLVQGAWVTVQVSVLIMALAIALGLPIALSRLYGLRPMRVAATVYVEFFRGIPVLLLLYFLYYGLPTVSENYGLGITLKLSAFAAAVVGFGLNYAAYEAEIYRAGIGSIPVGQWEAAASLGMSRGLTFRRIILPQAIRVILPPMGNEFISLLKDSSLVSVVAVADLTRRGREFSSKTATPIETWTLVALLYLVMTILSARVVAYIERKTKQA